MKKNILLFLSFLSLLSVGCLGTDHLNGTFDTEANPYSLVEFLNWAIKEEEDTSTTTPTITECGQTVCMEEFAIYDGSFYSASGNSDGKPNANETIRMDIAITNTSANDISNVVGTLTTTSSLVSIDSSTSSQSYGNLWGVLGGIQFYHGISDSSSSPESALDPESTSAFRITIPNTTPSGSVIPFTLTATDGSGNSWEMNFSMTVEATSASISFAAYSIYGDLWYSTSGNGDGYPNPGETIRMDIAISNTGSGDILNASGTLSTESSLLTVDNSSATQSYGTLYKKDDPFQYYHGTSDDSYYISNALSPDSENAFLITIPGTTPAGSVIPLTLTVSDGSGNSWGLQLNLKVAGEDIALDSESPEFYSSGSLLLDSLEYGYYGATSGYPLDTDGDGDAIWEKGERARFNLALENRTASEETVGWATVSCDGSYVTVEQPDSINYIALSAGDSAYLNGDSVADVENTWSMALASSTPSGTEIECTMSVTDYSANSYEQNFVYVVP